MLFRTLLLGYGGVGSSLVGTELRRLNRREARLELRCPPFREFSNVGVVLSPPLDSPDFLIASLRRASMLFPANW